VCYERVVADRKADVLEMLEELALLTTLDEGDVQSFKVRAYESAKRGVEAYVGDLEKLSAKDLEKLDGIGKSTAAKIRELCETNKVQKLEELRAKFPSSVVGLMKIPGVGPKAILKLRAELNVQSVDDLKKAIAEQKLRGLKGFGTKTEEKLAQTLARMDQEGAGTRTPISVALPLAERILAQLAVIPGVSHVSYCGSLRRFSETIGDLDLLVVAEHPVAVMDAVVAMTFVDHVLVKGDTKTSVVTRRGIQIDVRVVKREELGAAMLYFTGSKAHNIKLRMRAIARGWTLNEYALAEAEGGKVIASETEEAIYAALGLPFIPPVLREDQGEIEAAERGTLPKPIEAILGDFHVHTSLSGDGRSDIADVVAAARARGYRVLALTDHAEGTVSGVGRQPLLDQRERVRALQAELGDSMLLLHGVELNIGATGDLDYDAEFRAQFDFCLASVHDHFDLPREKQTARVIAAMRDPSVKMIGHLSARMIGGRPGIELDIDAILAAAEETGVALEVNGGLPRLDVSVDVMRRARDRKVTLVLTSDAHHATELERVRYASLNAQRAWIEPSQIVNTWEPERLVTWARDKRA
jgi:DNA polymerase (family 10)